MIQQVKCTINGTTVALLKAGVGKDTILLLHGSGMSARNWLPQLEDPALHERYSLIAIDLPGHGQSAVNDSNLDSLTPAGMAGLLPPLLLAQKTEHFLLAGLSFGSNVIGEIEQPLPGCQGLMLVSPCIVNNENPPSSFITAGPYGHVIATPQPSEEEVWAYINSHYCPPRLADPYIRDFMATDPRFRGQLAQFMINSGWTDELANIQRWQLPVCVVFGEKDTLLKSDYLDHFTPLWQEQVFKIPEAGHFVNEEQPEVFNQLLLQFATACFR